MTEPTRCLFLAVFLLSLVGSLLRLLSNSSAAPLADIFYNSAAAVGTVEHTLLCTWEAGCQLRLPLLLRNKVPGVLRITKAWAAMVNHHQLGSGSQAAMDSIGHTGGAKWD